MPSEYLEQKGQGRGYKQKPFSGFKFIGALAGGIAGRLLGGRKKRNRGSNKGNFRDFIKNATQKRQTGGFGPGYSGDGGSVGLGSIGMSAGVGITPGVAGVMTYKDKPTKKQVESWKNEFSSLSDPRESNRGKHLANKLMDVGVDPSEFANPKKKKKKKNKVESVYGSKGTWGR